MPAEDNEFFDLVGDLLVGMGSTHDELRKKGPVTLEIDGEKVTIDRLKPSYSVDDASVYSAVATIYDAAQKRFRGQPNPIPVLCHQENMRPAGVCRACLVEYTAVDRNGRESTSLVPSCYLPVTDGAKVRTQATSEKVKKITRTIVELLLSDFTAPNPQNCVPSENELPVVAELLGADENRFPRTATVRPTDLSSPIIAVDHNACILCDRCVRACNDMRDNQIIGRMGKGANTMIAFDLNAPMGKSDCVTCGECMVNCPTGALSRRGAVDSGYFDQHKYELPPRKVYAAELKDPAKTKNWEMFTDIADQFLDLNYGSVVRRHVRKGEVLCREGEYGATAFLIETGKYEICIRKPQDLEQHRSSLFGLTGKFLSKFVSAGKPPGVPKPKYISVDAGIALNLRKPEGEANPVLCWPKDRLFGEMACMNHSPRSATVIAIEDGEVLEVLRNVVYMMQRNHTSRKILDDAYRQHALTNFLRQMPFFNADIADTLKEIEDKLLKEPRLPPRMKQVMGEIAERLKKHAAEVTPAQRQQIADQIAARLKESAALVRAYPDSPIVRQGQKADHFYMVRMGFVKISQARAGGDVVLNYIGPGQYFGEIGLMSNLPELRDFAPEGVRIASANAVDHVDLVRVSGEQFKQILNDYPGVRDQFLWVALRNLSENAKMASALHEMPLGEFLDQGLIGGHKLLVLDLEKCTRCDECTRACADTHDGVSRLLREGLRFDKYLVASACRSCMDPYCLVGCPVGSIFRAPHGQIQIESWCIGCGQCSKNCPYGNITMHPVAGKAEVRGSGLKATTCDLCGNKENVEPACVFACPHDAAHRVKGLDLLATINEGRKIE